MTVMFKNALVYQLTQPAEVYIEPLKEQAPQRMFKPCGNTQIISVGFTAIQPGVIADPVADIQGVTLFAMKCQEKKVPSSAVNDILADKIAAIEEEQGRKVYRKERLTMKDEIILDLLPHIPPVSAITRGYIDPIRNLVVIDAGSVPRADEVLNLIRHTIGSFPVLKLTPTGSPAISMSGWLRDRDCPNGIAVMDEAVLRHPGELGAVARLKNEDLIGEAVQAMLNEGRLVESLRILSQSVSLTVTDEAWKLKRLVWPDPVEEGEPEEGEVARFESDILLMTTTLRGIIGTLGTAFGGWAEQEHLKLQEGVAA